LGHLLDYFRGDDHHRCECFWHSHHHSRHIHEYLSHHIHEHRPHHIHEYLSHHIHEYLWYPHDINDTDPQFHFNSEDYAIFHNHNISEDHHNCTCSSNNDNWLCLWMPGKHDDNDFMEHRIFGHYLYHLCYWRPRGLAGERVLSCLGFHYQLLDLD